MAEVNANKVAHNWTDNQRRVASEYKQFIFSGEVDFVWVLIFPFCFFRVWNEAKLNHEFHAELPLSLLVRYISLRFNHGEIKREQLKMMTVYYIPFLRSVIGGLSSFLNGIILLQSANGSGQIRGYGKTSKEAHISAKRAIIFAFLRRNIIHYNILPIVRAKKLFSNKESWSPARLNMVEQNNLVLNIFNNTAINSFNLQFQDAKNAITICTYFHKQR